MSSDATISRRADAFLESIVPILFKFDLVLFGMFPLSQIIRKAKAGEPELFLNRIDVVCPAATFKTLTAYLMRRFFVNTVSDRNVRLHGSSDWITLDIVRSDSLPRRVSSDAESITMSSFGINVNKRALSSFYDESILPHALQIDLMARLFQRECRLVSHHISGDAAALQVVPVDPSKYTELTLNGLTVEVLYGNLVSPMKGTEDPLYYSSDHFCIYCNTTELGDPQVPRCAFRQCFAHRTGSPCGQTRWRRVCLACVPTVPHCPGCNAEPDEVALADVRMFAATLR